LDQEFRHGLLAPTTGAAGGGFNLGAVAGLQHQADRAGAPGEVDGLFEAPARSANLLSRQNRQRLL